MARSPNDELDDAALKARLDKLSKSLGTRDDLPKSSPAPTGDTGFGNAMGAGLRVVTELVAGVIVGGGIGWLLDFWLHTKPVLMILFGCLGLAGGFWNIIRTAMAPPGNTNGG